MGRLASDGNDALLIPKLKVLLRKAFDKPDDEKGYTPPPIASYDNFVKLLDVDDPVAQRAIEILVEDVFKVARRRKRTIDTARQSQASLSSSSTRNAWSLTALDRDEHEERPETEVARNLREALEAAEHMRQNRGREMEEYDAIIADAQRRVASPLPIHTAATNEHTDNNDAAAAADSWETFYATHDNSSTAPWRRNLRNFNNAPSTTIFDSQDWPDLNSSVSASAASAARQLAWATEGNPSSNRRLNRSRRRIQGSDTESEADDITGGWGDGFMPAGWQDPQDAETIATISHRPARAVTQDEHRRMLNVDRALSRAQDTRDSPSSSYTTSSLANRALQPSSAAVRHAVIERIERRRRERDEAEADAAQRQLEFERAMLSAGWENRTRTSGSAAAGAAEEEGGNTDAAAVEVPPSVFHAPSTSSIRASLARNNSSSGIRRSRPLPTSFTSSTSTSAGALITRRTDSSLPPAVGEASGASAASTASNADTRTLRDSYDLVSGRYGLDSVMVPSPPTTSSLQRNTSIRRSGFHASPHSLRRTSSFSSTFPRTAQNPLSVSAPASSSALATSAAPSGNIVERVEPHTARDDFEAFSSRARRAAREARDASSEGGEHDTQASSASVPQGEPRWTGQAPVARTHSPVYGDDGRQLTPHELLRIAIAEDRANARAGATAAAGVGEGDAENVSELLGSSSTAAALSTSSATTDDTSRYLRPPGAPIISRRQYPIGRSPSFTTTRQVADGEAPQSQPIVIRWPSATVPEASIEIHDTRADTADQLLSLPEFLGELP